MPPDGPGRSLWRTRTRRAALPPPGPLRQARHRRCHGAVALPEGPGLAPTDTVFVLARNAASDSRMPIAVQRLQAAQLPVTLRLDDSNSMAGQKLSATESVMVVVQVSPARTPVRPMPPGWGRPPAGTIDGFIAPGNPAAAQKLSSSQLRWQPADP